MSRECGIVRAGLRSGPTTPEIQAHLFRCADCRARARLCAAWRGLAGVCRAEELEPCPEAFVRRVRAAVLRDRRRTRRRRLLAAAAAVFLFCAGAGASLRATGSPGEEEAYSRIADTSALDGLLPD